LRSRIDTNFNFCWLPANLLDNPSSPSPLTTAGGTTQYRLSGVALSGNLLVNGDFSQGNSSFQSDYVVSATAPSLAGTGQYAVYDSTVYAVPGAAACGNFLDGFGNRLIVRNNATDSARIWSSSVRIRPHTRYALSCRVQPVFNNSEAKLQFAVDDAAIGGLMNISAMACGWSLHQVIWNAGPDTLVNLSIINRSTAGGACFAIDDIRFAEYRTVQDSVRISVDTPMINTIDNQSTCRGVQVALTTTGGVRYRWVPATAVSDSVGASPIVSPADTLQFFVTGTTAAGCSATDSVEINILPTPAIDKSPDTSICRGDSAFLRVTGGQSYVWSPAQTLSASDIPNPAAGPVSNTTYYVSSSDPAFGCVATDSIRVGLKAATQFTLSASADSVCAGNPLQLTATGGTDYRWQPAGLLNNAEIADPIARLLNTTLFVVQIFDSVCNAIGVLSRRIVAKPLPRLILTKSNDIDCFDLNARLSVSGADTVRWFAEKLPLYLSDSSIFNPIAFPSSTKKYYVTGAYTLSGCTRIDSIIVYSYLKGNPPFIAPNSFTPNGDGLNDCWRAIPESRLLFFELSVYNRLGNRVFFTRNPNECWNGTYQGTPQDPGNYVYYIKASNNCKSEVSSGNLLLLR
jgi:gliding motility-associated-like protein